MRHGRESRAPGARPSDLATSAAPRWQGRRRAACERPLHRCGSAKGRGRHRRRGVATGIGGTADPGIPWTAPAAGLVVVLVVVLVGLGVRIGRRT